MEQKLYKASAPGSIMLLGEHAVLRYNEAIVCAIDQRISVTVEPQNNMQLIINSEGFQELITTIDNIRIQSPYEYVLAALLYFKQQLTTGLKIKIISSFSAAIGFGSSAAVTVAMVAVIEKYLYLSLTKQEIFNIAKQIMLNVQGNGSGADLAASVYGGVIHYTNEPFAVAALPIIDNITAVYSGAKLATKKVLDIVEQENAKVPKLYDNIFQGITLCVQQAIVAIKNKDWTMLGKLFSIHQGFMASLGVSSFILEELIWQLKEAGCLGAKISGSGLGDCVIGLGQLSENYFPINNRQDKLGVKQFPIKVALEGAAFE